MGEKYVLLVNNEIIDESYEFLDDDCVTWRPAVDAALFVGNKYNTNLHVPFRKIIPAEPKVLTAQQYLEDLKGEFTMDQMDDFRACFIDGCKNGRLERDLELREFVKIVKELCSDANNFSGYKSLSNCGVINDALENLKPLNSDENS